MRIFYSESDSPVEIIHKVNSNGHILSACWEVQDRILPGHNVYLILFQGTVLHYYLNVGFDMCLVNEQELTIAFHRI